MSPRRFAIAALCFAALGTQAANKCVGTDGKVTYTDALCPSNSKGESVKTNINSLDTSGSRTLVEQEAAGLVAGAAYQRCITAKANVEHSNSFPELRKRRAEARRECGEPEPSAADVNARRERIQRAAQIDATNRNTAAVQDSEASARADARARSAKQIELECKPGILSGTATCTGR